ncbi:TonB-dependent vitamin B12 receptor [Pseudomonas sp. UL073]|uniref:TonB-dependent vitamin B12 receptor n=1 Tax=Zestomonas insulae TaxID=2809017 RepID=A0ABS2ICH3_9GAMM|nr:TonB-dependent vitamin B12 receptor [Pseudomonas insulae]MBM7060715.1 TonB-dependent vitamin B12 receptor [Pseudomonas insulae]
MSKTLLTATAALLCGLSASLSSHAAERVFALDEQVVTAARVEQTPQHNLAATTVIDRAQIERSQAQSVPELLRRVPGISLANNGGPGKSTSLFMRGTNSNHVLVLIDGIKAGSVTSGGSALQDLPVELIERIEVVRGPRSSLYGSEAIGGVIQIFTRKGDGQGAKPFASAGYGTHDSYEGSAGVSGGDGQGHYSLGVSGQDTDGINVKPRGVSGYEDDSDGYRNLSGSLNGGYRFANGLELDGHVLQAKAHNDYDSVNSKRTAGFGANADGVTKVIGSRARFAPLEPWQVTLQAGRSEDKSDAYQDGAFYSRFDSRRDVLSWQNDLSLAEGQLLTLGADFQRDEVNSSTRYAEDSRDNHGAFVQYLGQFGRQDWQLSLRHDDDEQFGNHDTGNLGWGYLLTDELRFTANYGTAYKAPSFNQLYYPDFGNPDLQPEKSKSLEVGLSGEHRWGHWAANAYRTEIDNLIATVTSKVNGKTVSMAEGVDEARIRGVELVLGSELFGWAWNASYSLIDAENRSQRSKNGIAYYGKDLNRRPDQTFNLDLDRAFGDFSVGGSLSAQDASYDDLENQSELAGFATLDLRGEYRLNPEWRLQTRVANLFDADYQTAAGYNQPGQAVYFTVRYQAL